MSTTLPTPFYDLLKGLIRVPSVVGAEDAFFRALQRELQERGAKVTWYHGLLVAQGDDPESVMLSAHIDRHGLYCTGPNEFQYAAFIAGRRSDLLGNSASEKLMEKIGDRFNGEPVYAYEPWSGAFRGFGEISDAYLCEHRKNLIFEVHELRHVTPGTPLAFVDRLQTGNGQLIGQIDNVLTVAHLVYLFDSGFKGTAFFTAQEESGSSWRYLMEWFRRTQTTTDRLIVLDTSPFPDDDSVVLPDVVLRHRDVNAEFSEAMTAELRDLCEQRGVNYMFKDTFIQERNEAAEAAGQEPASLGSTEMGRVVAASEGVITGTTLQVPTTGYHTLHETSTVRSNEVFADLLRSVAGLFA